MKMVEGLVCLVILVLSPLAVIGLVVSAISSIAIMIIIGLPAERIFQNKKLDDRISKYAMDSGERAYAYWISPLVFLMELLFEPSLTLRERVKRALTPAPEYF